jgi:hypothetical protein
MMIDEALESWQQLGLVSALLLFIGYVLVGPMQRRGRSRVRPRELVAETNPLATLRLLLPK